MPITRLESEFIFNTAKMHNIISNLTEEHFTLDSDIALPRPLLLDIHDVPSLQIILKKIYKINLHKHPSNRISFKSVIPGKKSDQSKMDIFVRLMDDDFTKVEPTGKKNIMRIGGNIKMDALDKELYEFYNLSLSPSNVIPYEAVVGLTGHARHETGISYSTFFNEIKAMTVCLPNGDIIRLDASDQDFEIMHAAHMGLFGIVLSFDVECVEADVCESREEKKLRG